MRQGGRNAKTRLIQQKERGVFLRFEPNLGDKFDENLTSFMPCEPWSRMRKEAIVIK
jgi:hypothetical protein